MHWLSVTNYYITPLVDTWVGGGEECRKGSKITAGGDIVVTKLPTVVSWEVWPQKCHTPHPINKPTWVWICGGWVNDNCLCAWKMPVVWWCGACSECTLACHFHFGFELSRQTSRHSVWIPHGFLLRYNGKSIHREPNWFSNALNKAYTSWSTTTMWHWWCTSSSFCT